MFDFADRNEILFERNKEVDKQPERLVEDKHNLHPSLVAEIPGIDLQRDHTWTPTIEKEDDKEPQGRAKEATLNNADNKPAVAVGVTTPEIIQANEDQID